MYCVRAALLSICLSHRFAHLQPRPAYMQAATDSVKQACSQHIWNILPRLVRGSQPFGDVGMSGSGQIPSFELVLVEFTNVA